MDKYELIDRYVAEMISASAPDRPVWNKEAIAQGKPPKWNYIDGCMMISLYRLYEWTGNREYFDFVKNFIDYYVGGNGEILGFKEEDYNLDNVNEGRVLFDLFDETGDEKYLKAIETVYGQLARQPKNSKGSFWHKKIYPNQVWLDGLFMAQIFYYRYLTMKGFSAAPVLEQFRNVERFMKDGRTGLYYHGYDETRKAFWANPDTGLSANFWLRSLGWYIAALADIAAYLPAHSPEKAEFTKYLKNALDSVFAFEDGEKHMFWQVADKGGEAGNYLETSGSALIAYAALRGANAELLSNDYFEKGKEVFDGICREYLRKSESGSIELGGICLVAGLGPENKPHRDGSYAYYVSEPVVSTDAKGVAPFIMAFVELKKGL